MKIEWPVQCDHCGTSLAAWRQPIEGDKWYCHRSECQPSEPVLTLPVERAVSNLPDDSNFIDTNNNGIPDWRDWQLDESA